MIVLVFILLCAGILGMIGTMATIGATRMKRHGMEKPSLNLDYYEIARLEREIYGHVWPNVDAPNIGDVTVGNQLDRSTAVQHYERMCDPESAQVWRESQPEWADEEGRPW
jgi:hypothetical protein